MFSYLLLSSCFNARNNYFGVLWAVIFLLGAFALASLMGSIYYIAVFIVLSLAELYFIAEYYLFYLICSGIWCIFLTICVILDKVPINYLMMASPFALFTIKINNFCKKAFCITDKGINEGIDDGFTLPEFNYNIADISSPYALGPKRKTFAYHKSVVKSRPMGSYWSDDSDPADVNPAIRTFDLLQHQGLIDERFKSAVDTSRKLGQHEAYGRLTNQNPYGHFAPNDYPTSFYYDASPGPTPYHTPDTTPYHTPGIIPKSLPATPKMVSSKLKPTTTDIFYDANDF